MFNNPQGDTGKISIGPGILLIGPVGSTPSTDMGYVKGDMTLTFDRKKTEVRQGSPQTIVHTLTNTEDVMIEFTGVEWNLDHILHMLADGATSFSTPNEILKSGGRPTVTPKALRFQHRMADGSTMWVDLWKVIPDGELAIKINADDTHEFPYKFKAMYAGVNDWAGAALTDSQALFRIQKMRA